MSKVVIITNHSYMLYRFRRELIARLAQEHDVVLVMPFVGHEEDFAQLGYRCIHVPVDRRGINPAKDLALLKRYISILKEEAPDLVITYSIKPNVYGGLAAAWLNIPFCANVQGLGTAFQKPSLAQFVTLLYKIAFHKVKTVFFENQESAALFRDREILPEHKQVILSGAGINLRDYAYQPYPANDPVRFLYLGRIMKEKGIDELFAAVRQLHSRGFAFQLDLVGFYEDEYAPQVEELTQLGLVKFHGFQAEPRPYYTGTDCVVLPSYHEGMSNVLLEGAAMGRPLITSNIPGCREAVEDGVTGFLCAVRDEKSLADTMEKFLSLSPEQRTQMGLMGRRRMEALFDKDMVVQTTMDALPLSSK